MAQVLIRHEGLEVLSSPGNQVETIQARLLSARLIGRTSRVRLRVGEDTDSPIDLEARVPLTPDAKAGDWVWITVDRDRVLMFATT